MDISLVNQRHQSWQLQFNVISTIDVPFQFCKQNDIPVSDITQMVCGFRCSVKWSPVALSYFH